MALPDDAYPNSTQDGKQIRLDAVRIKTLGYIAFSTSTGTTPDAALIVADGVYVLLATEDCIVDCTGVATKLPVLADAIVLQAGERATVMFPVVATGLSAIGLTNAGTVYIQRIAAWAGLADSSTLGNQ